MEQAPIAYFDDRAKRVVEAAFLRAQDMRSEVVAPEHMLLALLAVRKGVAARVVTSLSGSLARAHAAIVETIAQGARPSPSHIPFTAVGEDAMRRAARQARQSGADRIGTEHLLLALLATDNPAVRRLAEVGVDYDAAQAEIARLRAEN